MCTTMRQIYTLLQGNVADVPQWDASNGSNGVESENGWRNIIGQPENGDGDRWVCLFVWFCAYVCANADKQEQ